MNPQAKVSRPQPRDAEPRQLGMTHLGMTLLRSEELFGEQREIMIQHAGSYYRLRLTHSNKLILTK
jgi:hemin uptake protein HemP